MDLLRGRRKGICEISDNSLHKSEIVHKVYDIVKKQLAVPDDSNATGESKFTNL
jgi:hypothetical protein